MKNFLKMKTVTKMKHHLKWQGLVSQVINVVVKALTQHMVHVCLPEVVSKINISYYELMYVCYCKKHK